VGGSVNGYAFGDGGRGVRKTIAKTFGLDAVARMPVRDMQTQS
jgi:hypothetical protein